MADQGLLQGIAQSDRGTLIGRFIRLIIPDTDVKLGLLSVGIDQNEDRCIVCRKGIEYRGELVCHRLALAVDHLLDTIKAHIVDQVLFQRR